MSNTAGKGFVGKLDIQMVYNSILVFYILYYVFLY